MKRNGMDKVPHPSLTLWGTQTTFWVKKCNRLANGKRGTLQPSSPSVGRREIERWVRGVGENDDHASQLLKRKDHLHKKSSKAGLAKYEKSPSRWPLPASLRLSLSSSTKTTYTASVNESSWLLASLHLSLVSETSEYLENMMGSKRRWAPTHSSRSTKTTKTDGLSIHPSLSSVRQKEYL